jgi:S-adenosylmethionine hydrolase
METLNMPALVTLTTDFGEREPSVAEIKGVIHSNCPGVHIVDLGHSIPQGNIMETAFFTLRSIPRFPAGTVHLVNVAPGPDPVIVSVLGQLVVCPDNGILTMLSHHHEIEAVHRIAPGEPASARPGQVFFGRDVFAPAVARLANGAEPAELGDPREGLTLLDVPHPERAREKLIQGQIIYINRFGSLVTNIHASDLEGLPVSQVRAGDFTLGPIRQTYAEVPPKMPLALLGSAGYLEIAYNGDRADERLGFTPGIVVRVTLDT